MKINLELYGPLTDITKIKHFELDGVNDTESLVKELHKQFPALERSGKGPHPQPPLQRRGGKHQC